MAPSVTTLQRFDLAKNHLKIGNYELGLISNLLMLAGVFINFVSRKCGGLGIFALQNAKNDSGMTDDRYKSFDPEEIVAADSFLGIANS